MSSSLPVVLAIDTATEVCSVALLHGEHMIERVETVGNKHSDRALPMIDDVLAHAALRLSDVDVFAFGAGPGSFTGLRIACGIAQGLAYGKGKRVVPIGNLRALAEHAFATSREGETVLAAIDARMNEAYGAVYRRDAHISELRAPALERPQSLLELADSINVDIVAGNALAVFTAVWPQGKPWNTLPQATPTAANIARLARIDAQRGLSVPPAQAAPVYVRDHVALTIEERQRVSS